MTRTHQEIHRVVVACCLVWIGAACDSFGDNASRGGSTEPIGSGGSDGGPTASDDAGATSGTGGSGGIGGELDGGDGGEGVAYRVSLPGPSLPCAITEALAPCRTCHAATPLFGAPMALITAADFAAPAISDASQSVAQAVALRTHDSARPMPPTGLLPDDPLARLDAWLAAGALGADATDASTCDEPSSGGDAGADGGSSPEWPNDCEQTYSFRSHTLGDTSAPYHVTPDQTDAYVCWYFDAPWEGSVQGLAFRAAIDESAVVHHWLLYGSEDLPHPPGTVGPCSDTATQGDLLTGWAPGREDLVMPDDVGLQMPSGSNAGLILQIHYYANGADAFDASGVDVCTTTTPRTHAASISWLGSSGMELPPGEETPVSGRCAPGSTQPIHIVRTWPHMHLLGRRMTMTVNRAGGGSESMLDRMFNFEAQASYETPVTLMPGDSITTTCLYQNDGETSVFFGESTNEEMCLAFVYAYPANALRTGVAADGRNYCIAPAR